ncbi:MAG: SDR family NAD(P)-dependent oxidoreductase, partial [Nevskia sp.]|nr:SDR family NAD(P)-dependent oxidoreductase [Nevskia sp.]
MSKLKSKVALVTGAGQGVGQGIAFALAQEGAAIAVTGRTLAKVEATAAEIVRRGGKALALACDVKNAASLHAGLQR